MSTLSSNSFESNRSADHFNKMTIEVGHAIISPMGETIEVRFVFPITDIYLFFCLRLLAIFRVTNLQSKLLLQLLRILGCIQLWNWRKIPSKDLLVCGFVIFSFPKLKINLHFAKQFNFLTTTTRLICQLIMPKSTSTNSITISTHQVWWPKLFRLNIQKWLFHLPVFNNYNKVDIYKLIS